MPPCLRVQNSRHGRSGFTLVEMLVVIAITVVLMGLLLGPLTQAFRMTTRGRAMIAAQDNARSAMVRIARDVQDAMVVYDGLPIYMYGYDGMNLLRGRPHPDTESQPSIVRYPPAPNADPSANNNPPIEYRDAMFDVVLPKSQHYCTGFNHYVPESAISENEAIEKCPLAGHEQSDVVARPIEPLTPSGTRVRYFVGLQHGFDPNSANGTGAAPPYMNPLLFTMSGSEFNNPYVLYRAEFNPNPTAQGGENFQNWRTPGGQINPNFWYDTRRAPGGRSFAYYWKQQAVAIISPLNTDMVRWVRDRNNERVWLPQPMTRFTAAPIENETLDPNRETAAPDGAGGLKEAARVPMQYVADYGHWTGPVNDMTLPLAPGILMGTTRPAANVPFALGPRIQIYDSQAGAGGPRMALVYDSAVPASEVARKRLFTWDSSRGIVNFALRADTRLAIQPAGDPALDEVPFSVSLRRDRQVLPLPLVTDLAQTQQIAAGFGSLKNDPLLGETVRIAPGGELVQALDSSGQPVRTFERAGWLGTGRDQIVAQADLEPDQYVIDYGTGLIMFSDRDPNLAGAQIHIRYQMHTNKATDVVRVSYATRELLSINVGLLQFDPSSGDPQEIQVNNRIRLRNLTR